MSFCTKGLECKVKTTSVTVKVLKSEPLIQLCNQMNWNDLATLVLPDLKETTGNGMWWLGRKLRLRTHLGVLILQCLMKETDRGVEARIKQTPVLQIFCGKSILKLWKCPDHTKIEEFRNRLKPETHQKFVKAFLLLARDLGFADPSILDIDSTVQSANIAYPADSTLMKKLAEKCHRVLSFMKTKSKKRFKDIPTAIAYREDQEKGSILFLFSEECFDREKTRDLQGISSVSKSRNRTDDRFFGRPQFKTNCKPSLEHTKGCGADSECCLEVFAGCCSLHQNSHNQTRKNTFSSRKCSQLHQKRKSWQRQRIWPSTAARKNCRKFYDGLQLHLYKDARQNVTHSGGRRIRKYFWEGGDQVTRYGQRVLQKEKHLGPCRDGNQYRWSATASECKNPSDPRNQRYSQGPPSGNRTFDWTRKILRTWEEQNEIGRDDALVRVPLRPWLQFASTDAAHERTNGLKKRASSGRLPSNCPLLAKALKIQRF